jgi:hypothetical protein
VQQLPSEFPRHKDALERFAMNDYKSIGKAFGEVVVRKLPSFRALTQRFLFY